MAFIAADGSSYCRIRYPDPAIKVNDTVKIDLSTGKISDFIRFDTGVIAMATGGRNMGRVGVITHRERHDGGFNIVHIKDAIDNSFATRETNVFVIGNEKPWISLPKGKGVKVRCRWSFSTRLPESMLIVISCPLQRREIVAVPMQLQATRMPSAGSRHRIEDQYSISSLVFDLKIRHSNRLLSIIVLVASIVQPQQSLPKMYQQREYSRTMPLGAASLTVNHPYIRQPLKASTSAIAY